MRPDEHEKQKLSEDDWQRLNENHMLAIRVPVLVILFLATLGLLASAILEAVFWDISASDWFVPIRAGTIGVLLLLTFWVWRQKHSMNALLNGSSLFSVLLCCAFGVMAWDNIDFMILLPGFTLLLLMNAPLLFTHRNWVPVQLFCLLLPFSVLWLCDAPAHVWTAYAVYLLLAAGLALLLRTVRINSMVHGYRYQKWLLEHSRTDDLTGLRNRSGLDVDASKLMHLAKTSEEPLAMMFIDLDHFKGINDELGHAHGDHVLKLVGEQLEQCVRSDDVVARVGGDEFVVIVRKANASVQRSMAERMRESVLKHPELGALSISVGIATWDGEESMQTLRHRADLAMLEAKRLGKNRVHLADGDTPDSNA